VEAMRQRGIEMPFPQYEVYLRASRELPQELER
jgi:small-conductance mechanosensitive channel